MEIRHSTEPRTANRKRRVVIAAFGSYGDINPYLGLALGLRARGYEPVFATGPFYQEYIEREGISFRPLRPYVSPYDPEFIASIMNPRKGIEFMRRRILPNLRDAYDDLTVAVDGADLLITNPVIFVGPLVAESCAIPWASTVLAPISFFSTHDFPVLPHMSAAKVFERIPGAAQLLKKLAKTVTRPLTAPVARLRADCGLPPGGDPLYEGQHSPALVLALFSRLLAAPQPDWPANVQVTGPILYNGPDQHELSDKLANFLEAGPPPVVFTLGSLVVSAAGNFYEESAAAARRLGVRAVLLVGRNTENRPKGRLPDGVIAVDHAPHAALFPRAAAVVHQGGAGTLHQALYAGRPMLIVPHAFDQPDNAYRAARLGSGRVLYPNRYTASRVAAELRRILEELSYTARAAEIAAEVREEDGVTGAWHALEGLLAAKSQTIRATA